MVTEKQPAGNAAPSVTSTTTTEAKSDSNGKAAAVVTESQVTNAVNMAVEVATQKEVNTQTEVVIKVIAPNDSKSVELSIPEAAFDIISDGKIDAMTVLTPIAAITFDDKALSAISKGAEGDVKITTSRIDAAATNLSKEDKERIGDRPVFNFSVTNGGNTISEFGGNVTVSVPYTPKKREDMAAIIIYYINAKGKLEIVHDCVYDAASKTIIFNTDHFSIYAVGYNKVSFTDVPAGAWYSKAVSFIAARGITTGTGNGRFSPQAKLTRGQFIVMVMRAYSKESHDAVCRDRYHQW